MTFERGRPTYQLEDLWHHLDKGEYLFHRPAREGFTALGWTEADALLCLRALSREGIRKSMPGRQIKGWHDVYRSEWGGERVYIHFCQTDEGLYVVAALKRDTEMDG